MTRAQHALIAIVLAGLTLLIVHAALITPYHAMRTQFGERIEALEFQYEKTSRITAQAPQLTAAIATLRKLPVDKDAFLAGGSPALAAAALQKHLETLIEQHGGTLKSVRVVPTKMESVLPPVALQVQASMDIGAMRGVLHAAESGRPLLLLDNVMVRGRNRAADPRRSTAPGELDVQFTATGFLGR